MLRVRFCPNRHSFGCDQLANYYRHNIIDSIKKKYDIKYNVFSVSEEECHRLNLQSGFPKNIVIDTAGNIKYVSLMGQLNNFTGIIYPLISKEL